MNSREFLKILLVYCLKKRAAMTQTKNLTWNWLRFQLEELYVGINPRGLSSPSLILHKIAVTFHLKQWLHYRKLLIFLLIGIDGIFFILVSISKALLYEHNKFNHLHKSVLKFAVAYHLTGTFKCLYDVNTLITIHTVLFSSSTIFRKLYYTEILVWKHICTSRINPLHRFFFQISRSVLFKRDL